MPSLEIAYESAQLLDLARLEARHFWFRARRRIIVDALARWFPQCRRYLEIGCGTGYVANGVASAFPGWQVIASDPLCVAAELWAGAPRPTTSFVRLDALSLPFVDCVDVVGAYDVLEHIEDHASALRAMWSACRPGGGLLLAVPQHEWMWSPADEHARHVRRYTAPRLRQVVEAAGFELIADTGFATLTLPFAWIRARFILPCEAGDQAPDLIRGWWRGRRGQRRVQSRPPRHAARGPLPPLRRGRRESASSWRGGAMAPARAPPALLNAAFDLLMEGDRRMIAAGVRLPVGGSLLLAARRPSGSSA